MASVDKFTHEAMSSMLRHNSRETEEPLNVDIDPERSELNYSFEMDHGGLTDCEYYKKLVGEKYIWTRYTERRQHRYRLRLGGNCSKRNMRRS